ncbi:SixA phosphatase family protein [Alteriqipengyuania lutimaris]|uniref:Histidine phosphatase family protein n=1 Tax=Alteriqipengyuania lutimaris TaxID=1538146 RepID=A0A395LLG2_9SPHN|nr:histidine phosphatase family protein [Alteriqipengyuania lutimaris]MBB3033164.1 phosphohistidine phosphatase [Alteriqipengyuania lutimaris]RDS77782.1 histidine phosphatase family protein [Alteriqipengyuania lutimaris]
MKYLGLFRHAKSDWDDRDQRDFDRGLNERGREGARIMGRHIRRSDYAWDCLLASPAQRVRLTLEEAAIGVDPHFDQRLYLAGPETHFEVVKELAGESDALMLAAHNPGLQDVVLALVSAENETADFREAMVKFPTASFAVLELPIDDWSELGAQNAKLVHFKRPRDLDATLGPVD